MERPMRIAASTRQHENAYHAAVVVAAAVATTVVQGSTINLYYEVPAIPRVREESMGSFPRC